MSTNLKIIGGATFIVFDFGAFHLNSNRNTHKISHGRTWNAKKIIFWWDENQWNKKYLFFSSKIRLYFRKSNQFYSTMKIASNLPIQYATQFPQSGTWLMTLQLRLLLHSVAHGLIHFPCLHERFISQSGLYVQGCSLLHSVSGCPL